MKVQSLGLGDFWFRVWKPTPVFLPGEFYGQRSLVGYSPRGRKESDTTERLHLPLEKEMATHSSTLAWRILWTEEPGGLQSMGSQRVGHNWATSLLLSLLLNRVRTAIPIFYPAQSSGPEWGFLMKSLSLKEPPLITGSQMHFPWISLYDSSKLFMAIGHIQYWVKKGYSDKVTSFFHLC